MPVPFFFPPHFKVRQELQSVEYSECIAEYTHCCSATLSFEYCCQNSHAKMTARLDLFPSFCIILFLFHCILSVFSPFLALHGVSLAYWWLTLKDRVPCSVCHCQSAQEYQWPAAQSDQFFGGRSTVYLTSACLIIVSKHKPIDSCRHLHPATPTTLAPYLKPLVFEVIQAALTVARSTGPTENCTYGFVLICTLLKNRTWWVWMITTRQLKLRPL